MIEVEDSPDNVRHPVQSKPVPAPRESKKKNRDNEMNLMSSINDNMSTMTNFFTSNPGASRSGAAAAASAPPDDCISVWSNLVAIYVRRMPEAMGEDFRFEVDRLAHKYLNKLKEDGSNK